MRFGIATFVFLIDIVMTGWFIFCVLATGPMIPSHGAYNGAYHFIFLILFCGMNAWVAWRLCMLEAERFTQWD